MCGQIHRVSIKSSPPVFHNLESRFSARSNGNSEPYTDKICIKKYPRLDRSGEMPQNERIPKLLGAFARLLRMSEAVQPLVLVVEDEELLRLHAANLLEDHGYRVIEAANADAALKVLETRNDVRLLFTDIQMPGKIDGMDLARQVHARWPNVLLLITSGQISPTRAEIPDDGRFVAKPYRSYELLAQVDDLAGRT
jgi:two-component system, response regulator PdtaR